MKLRVERAVLNSRKNKTRNDDARSHEGYARCFQADKGSLIRAVLIKLLAPSLYGGNTGSPESIYRLHAFLRQDQGTC